MVGWSKSHGSWRAIRKPFVKASAIWKRKRMRQRGASEKRGRTPAASRRTADPGSEPPPTVTGVHRRRSDARRRAVDQPVVARVVAAAVGDGHARQSADDRTAAAQTQDRLAHGAEEKTDGPSSRPHRANRND